MSESQKTAASQDVKMEVEKNRNRAALRRTFFGRVIRSVVVAFWVMVIAFSLIRLSPGDPVRMALGADVTEEAVEEFRTQLGLDKNFLTQFWDYFSGILRGDLGYSYFSGRDVTEIVGTHLPVTLMIIFLSILFAAIISIPLALFVATSKSNTVNYLFRALTSISLAIPGFFLALMGLLVFGVYLNIAPAAGYEGAFPGNLKYLWLPALANCGSLVPVLSRVLHSSIVDTLDEEFVETGVIRGVRKGKFYWSYLLRPSLAPTVVLLSYMVGVMIGGTVIMETIFSLPGIGRELITAVDGRDYPVVQSIAMIFGLIVVFFSFIGDLTGYLLDRRVTLS
ncbi:MAG: ABC transporter permease [Candidatus Nanopelagicaceae bacterium]